MHTMPWYSGKSHACEMKQPQSRIQWNITKTELLSLFKMQQTHFWRTVGDYCKWDLNSRAQKRTTNQNCLVYFTISVDFYTIKILRHTTF